MKQEREKGRSKGKASEEKERRNIEHIRLINKLLLYTLWRCFEASTELTFRGAQFSTS